MMKKVLALVMVLSMVGYAGAALQIDVAGGKAVVNGQLDRDEYLVFSAGNGASLSNFALGAMAPGASFATSQGSATDFAAAGAPVPAGFDGEAWFLASFPGEAYKNGEMLTADVKVETEQSTATREEKITDDCPPGWWKIRTWTDVTETIKGALSLCFVAIDANTGDILTGLLADKDLGSSKVTSTFVDGPCIPEPMTLSLLGLGALLLRRRS